MRGPHAQLFEDRWRLSQAATLSFALERCAIAAATELADVVLLVERELGDHRDRRRGRTRRRRAPARARARRPPRSPLRPSSAARASTSSATRSPPRPARRSRSLGRARARRPSRSPPRLASCRPPRAPRHGQRREAPGPVCVAPLCGAAVWRRRGAAVSPCCPGTPRARPQARRRGGAARNRTRFPCSE
jgi:hypothetical protein